MKFIDKALAPMNEKIEDISNQVSALAAIGMVAFILISLVAVTALVKASK